MTVPTPNTITLVPRPGRDYSSKVGVAAHLNEGRDFIVADMSSRWDGKPCNINDLKAEGIGCARIRYDRLRKVCLINIGEIS